MSSIRHPAVADRFYPAEPTALRHMIDDYLSTVEVDPSATPPKALIVPHAGYIYSGPVAATAYATLKPVRERITRVVLLGPSHHVPLRGLATSPASVFRTPLGNITLDRQAIERISSLPQVHELEQAHASEHSLEVQLPFLQVVLERFTLVPLVVGEAESETVAAVIKALWGGPETLIVVSSDLSHYHDYATGQQLDRATSEAIESLQPQLIGYDQACGRNPLNGLLYLAQRLGLRAHTLDLRNSGDTAGPHDQVVGYGAYALH